MAAHRNALTGVAAPLKPALLERPIAVKAERLAATGARLAPAVRRGLINAADRLAGLEKLRVSFNPDGPLSRGFARVHGADGRLARSATCLKRGEALKLVFHDGERGAVVDGPAPAHRKTKPEPTDQGRLF